MSGQPIPRDRPWHLYPNGTKAPAHGGGHWLRVTGGWKWCTGDVFPNPGGDNMDMVILPTPPAPAAVEERCDYIGSRGIRCERQQNHDGPHMLPLSETPPAERPTPITLADEVGAMVHAFSDADRRDRVRELARQVADLERQLAVFRDGADAMHRIAAACQCPTKDAEIAILKGQLAGSREQRDRLATALELGIQLEETGNIWSVRPDKFQAFLKSAKTALHAAKGGGK